MDPSNHLRNLIHFAHVDDNLHEKELQFIHRVGARFGLSPQQVDQELTNRVSGSPGLPEEAVSRFLLLDDVINLMAADRVLEDREITECRRMAETFGFDSAVIDGLIEKLRIKIEQGSSENETALLIKEELFTLASKNRTYAKYR